MLQQISKSTNQKDELFPQSIPGTYILVLESHFTREIRIGSLGIVHILPGFYLYVGSAFGPGGLRARLSHHLKSAPKPHWHIDYLRNEVELKIIGYNSSPEKLEHKLAEYLGSLPVLTIPLPRFGASDCRCPAHLFYNPDPDTINLLLSPFNETESFCVMKFIYTELQ
jgi:Uri superfamily endonuclease